MQRTRTRTILSFLMLAGVACLLSCRAGAIAPMEADAQQIDEAATSAGKIYTIYYNVAKTEYGAYLIATGWANQAGVVPTLFRDGRTNTFTFFLKGGGDVGAQVITPLPLRPGYPTRRDPSP